MKLPRLRNIVTLAVLGLAGCVTPTASQAPRGLSTEMVLQGLQDVDRILTALAPLFIYLGL